MKYSFFLFLALISTVFIRAQDKNIFRTNWQEKHFINPSQSNTVVLNEVPSAINIHVTPHHILTPINPSLFGVNTTFRNGSDQCNRDNLYKNHTNILRYPAGSGSNTYFFDGIEPSSSRSYDKKGKLLTYKPINGTNRKVMTPQIFAEFKQKVNGEATIVVNYFYARYGITSIGTRRARVKQAADYAASFVHKMNIELGANIKYWEVGNECYGPWEYGYDVEGLGKVTGKEYGEDFCVFAEAMKAIDPSIKVGAVIKPEDGEWNKGTLPEIQEHADFLIVHEYFTTVKEATLESLIAAPAIIAEDIQNIKDCVGKYTEKENNHFPVAMTEFNLRGTYNCSMINGITIAQIIGEQIKQGYGMSSLWVSEWKWSNDLQESKGFLALNDPQQADYTARPSYLPYYYFGKCLGNQLINTTSNHEKIKVYASTFTSGEIGMVIINTSNEIKQFRISLEEESNQYSAYWYHCYANTVDLTENFKKFYINGVTGTTSGGGPSNLDSVLPNFSIMNNASTFSINPYGMIFLVLNQENENGMHNSIKKQEIKQFVTNEIDLTPLKRFNSVSLYTSKGCQVFCSKHQKQRIDVSSLPHGVYFLTIDYPHQKDTYKIIKG